MFCCFVFQNCTLVKVASKERIHFSCIVFAFLNIHAFFHYFPFILSYSCTVSCPMQWLATVPISSISVKTKIDSNFRLRTYEKLFVDDFKRHLCSKSKQNFWKKNKKNVRFRNINDRNFRVVFRRVELFPSWGRHCFEQKQM